MDLAPSQLSPSTVQVEHICSIHRVQPSLGRLPHLSDGFNIQLGRNDWAALFPSHHLMWASPSFVKTRDFIKSIKRSPDGYSTFLSEPMRQSFDQYYLPYVKNSAVKSGPIVKGEVLDPTICFLATNDCNLGCKYCFSGAEPKKFGAIPWDIAKAAIDMGVRNGVLNRMRTGQGRLEVNFYGGGEPTEYWDVFVAIVEYARAAAQQSGISVGVATITNGQIDEDKWKWFRNNINEFTISMDGPREIHDAQRPTFSGESSFAKSWNFLSAMTADGMQVKSIRVSVTAQTVFRLGEIAEYFWDNLSRPLPIQFEPVYFSEVGRQNSTMPGALEFVAGFREVEELARRRELAGRPFNAVATATRPLGIRSGAYCDSLEGKGMFITPNGFLSLCSEVSTPNDPRKDKYFVGGYDAATKRFRVLDEKKDTIRCGSPWWCRGCFAHFSCAGGCEPRSQNSDTKVRKWWCQMVRHNIKGTWSDVRTGKIEPRARIGDAKGEELIWLPMWTDSPSMD
jgi:radical SAM protein with 4Fe4S-binding SPASM domain